LLGFFPSEPILAETKFPVNPYGSITVWLNNDQQIAANWFEVISGSANHLVFSWHGRSDEARFSYPRGHPN